MRFHDEETNTMRYLGCWRGRVADISNDPLQGFRIKAYVPSILRSELTGWATPKLPPNINGVPEVGDQVWIEFEQGDVDKPIWSGWIPSSKDGALPASPTMIAQDDDTVAYLIGKGGGLLEIDDPDSEDGKTKILESTTNSQPEYPNIRGIRLGKNLIEIDGTPNQQRIQIYHESGAYFEIGPTGNVRKKSLGTDKEWVNGSKTTAISGSKIEVVEGKEKKQTKKESYHYYDRGLQEKISGNDHSYTNSGNYTLDINGSNNLSVGGSYILSASQIKSTSLGDRYSATLGNANEIITGAKEVSIQNSNFSFGQTVGYKTSLSLGDIEYKALTGKIIQEGALGVELKTQTGFIRVGPSGKIALGLPGIELVNIVYGLISDLSLATTATQLGAQPLSIVPQLLQYKALLEVIKE